MIEINTKRLLLRPLCEGDLDAFHRLQSNEQVTRFTKQGPNKSIERTQQMLDDSLVMMNSSSPEEPVLILAICIPPSNELIGTIGTFRPREVGFSLHPSCWGAGYATEAVEGFCTWYAERFPGQQLFAKVDMRNEASLKVCKRTGFMPATMQEIERDEALQADNERDTWLWRR